MNNSIAIGNLLGKPSAFPTNTQSDQATDLIALRFEAIRWGRIAARLKRRLHDAEAMQDRAFGMAQQEEARLILETPGEIEI